MNEFTKEELEELWFFTELHKEKYRLKHPQQLLDKIQSMIDNYCEHDQGTTEDSVLIDICKKCGEFC